MKPLPTEFEKNTFQYKQIWRDQDHAIYEQSDNGKFVAFEVFKINKNEEGDRGFGFMPAAETVPPITQWGNAWTCASLEDCHGKVEIMKKSAERKLSYAGI